MDFNGNNRKQGDANSGSDESKRDPRECPTWAAATARITLASQSTQKERKRCQMVGRSTKLAFTLRKTNILANPLVDGSVQVAEAKLFLSFFGCIPLQANGYWLRQVSDWSSCSILEGDVHHWTDDNRADDWIVDLSNIEGAI